jgi:Ca-activated chloride channel family protein
MLRLENMHLIYIVGALPLCIVLYVFTQHWKKTRIKRFGEAMLLARLMPDVSRAKSLLRFILFLLALSGVIMAVLNPQTGSRVENVKRRSAQIIIALDVSNSMKAEDLSPNRLERAKQAISRLIDKLQGDELGLIVFAGKAYVQLPVTTDYAAAKLFLDNIDTDIIPTQGTSLSSAIDLAVESYGGEEGKNRALIIITDGEDHEGGVTESAAAAAKKGIVIHAIGLGSPAGVPIPAFQGKIRNGFRKDRSGATVITRLNEQVLQEIASAGHGMYIHGSNNEIGLNNLLEEINKMDKAEFEGKVYKEYDDYFFYFVWGAIILLVVESLVSERKSKLYQRLNLFGERK